MSVLGAGLALARPFSVREGADMSVHKLEYADRHVPMRSLPTTKHGKQREEQQQKQHLAADQALALLHN
ncbi:hypothetical protein J3B02_001282, partial [Coemansia erecta]